MTHRDPPARGVSPRLAGESAQWPLTQPKSVNAVFGRCASRTTPLPGGRCEALRRGVPSIQVRISERVIPRKHQVPSSRLFRTVSRLERQPRPSRVPRSPGERERPANVRRLFVTRIAPSLAPTHTVCPFSSLALSAGREPLEESLPRRRTTSPDGMLTTTRPGMYHFQTETQGSTCGRPGQVVESTEAKAAGRGVWIRWSDTRGHDPSGRRG